MTEPTTKKRIPCLCFSRVVGYISLAQHGGEYMWNKGKAQEWQDRRTYDWRAAVEEGER